MAQQLCFFLPTKTLGYVIFIIYLKFSLLIVVWLAVVLITVSWYNITVLQYSDSVILTMRDHLQNIRSE